jgi:signal transduction histidine kinase
LQAENLWQQARVVIEETEQRVQAYQQLQAEEQVQILREIGATLITTFDVGELVDVLTEELPRLDIPGAYLALYEDPQPYEYPQPAPEWSQLILAYDMGGIKGPKRVELDQHQRFPSHRLLPAHIWPQKRRYTMVVASLRFQERQIGFALFEVGPREGRIYETLGGEISSALFGAFLLQERQQAEVELGKAYTEVERQVEERTRELQQEIVERRRTEEELKRYRTHLEELVGERTRELEQAQAELVRQERLSALGELTATVAHEIRNPLGTVRTSVFAIENAIKRDEMGRVERALQLAERNIIRCDNIISELLDYTRDRVLQLKPVNINVWLDQVLDEQAIPENIVCIRALEANVEASNLEASRFEASIDSEHLRRAIINVISNAVDAMQKKGAGRSFGNPSELVEGLVEGQNRLTVSTHIVGDRLEIRVSDTGGGIPDAVMDRLFEPLFSTKNFGVGLGLPIVKNIMEQHGGGVEIQSKVGQGTDVTLWLPISDSGND